jgi:cell division protein FtsB
MPAMMPSDPQTSGPAAAEPRSRRSLRAVQDTRARRRRVVKYALGIASFMLMVNALFGENGYLAGVRARHEYEARLASLARLRLENQKLLEETRRLEQDPAALEEVARREHGLARPGEVLVIVRDAKPAAPAPQPK